MRHCERVAATIFENTTTMTNWRPELAMCRFACYSFENFALYEAQTNNK